MLAVTDQHAAADGEQASGLNGHDEQTFAKRTESHLGLVL
jgi:hypothetical protein